MKSTLLAAALLAAAATPSHAVYFKAGVLNQACQTNTGEAQAQCGAYIIGLLNGVETADAFDHLTPAQQDAVKRGDLAHIPPDPPRTTLVCVPPSETAFQLVNHVTYVLTADIKKYPQDADMAAADLVWPILQRLYPCNKAPRNPSQ